MAKYSPERLAKQAEGIARAKRAGKHLGRPPKADPEKVRKQWDQLRMDELMTAVDATRSVPWRIKEPQYGWGKIDRPVRWEQVGYPEPDKSTAVYAEYHANLQSILREFRIGYDLLQKYLEKTKHQQKEKS